METHGFYLVKQPKGNRIVEVGTKKEEQDLLNRGFREVEEPDAMVYLEERNARLSQSNLAKDGILLDVYYRTAQKRGDGYGMSSQNLVRELRKHGIRLNPNYNAQKIGLIYHKPDGVIQMQNDIRLLYTMFESDKTPRAVVKEGEPRPVPFWKEACEFADQVIVPSTFCQKTFERDGIETELIPLGYNTEVFKPIKRELPKDGEPFVFLHYNAFDIRKGFLELWKAFTEEFDPKESVKLILKTREENHPFPVSRKEYPNIEVIKGDISEEEMLGILGRSHCFVFPSRGEGFGIPPLEAMGTGLATILPNAHGIADYFKAECMYEVKVAGRCPGVYNSYKGMDTGSMVQCDVADLRKKMRYVFEHQKEAIAKGIEASRYVPQFSYENTAKKFADLLFAWDKKKIERRKDTDLLSVEYL